MASVVIPGGIEILQTVQTVLHCMIADMILIQVIPDGVGIAIYIHILVFPSSNRPVLSTRAFRFSKLLDILDSTKVAVPAFLAGSASARIFNSFKNVTYA